MKSFDFELLFTFDSPPNLLYGIREKGGEPIPFRGLSLADGKFLLERFANSGDIFFFTVYEWILGPETLGGNRPRQLQVATQSFANKLLFTQDPEFGPDDFLKEPAQDSSTRFSSTSNIVRWSTDSARNRPFQVIELFEQTVFELSARLVVVPVLPSIPGRTFYFDPEMVVGPDGDP